MKKIVVIPTLNENKNIDILFSNLSKLNIKFDLFLLMIILEMELKRKLLN